MTREEFEAFMQGEQWTPEQVARWRNFTPLGSAEVVKREMRRPDGCVEVSLVRRPFWVKVKRLLGSVTR